MVAGSAPELGWIEEQNFNFGIRIAQGQIDRLPGFASEIVGLNVDVIAVIGAVTVRAVQKATSTIPIVFSVVVKPVGDKLTTNLQRPDGNATGVTTFQAAGAAHAIDPRRPGCNRARLVQRWRCLYSHYADVPCSCLGLPVHRHHVGPKTG